MNRDSHTIRFATLFKSAVLATMWFLVSLLVLLPVYPEAGAASPTLSEPEQIDDSNETLKPSQKPPVNWGAVWGAVGEYEAQTYARIRPRQFSSEVAMPQPWHYVQSAPVSAANALISMTPGYDGYSYGPIYPYAPPYAAWWGVSPWFHWWSTISFRDHHRHHGGGHRKHHGARDHHRSR